MSEAQIPSTDKPPSDAVPQEYRGKLLIAEPPLQVLPTLAKLLKLGPAMFLQQVHWWINFGSNEKGIEIAEHGGRTWVRLTPEILERKFSFVDHRTLQRYVSSLRNTGVLLTENLNKIRLDPTLWYAVDYERLHELEQGGSADPDPSPENNVVHDNDILSFASATSKKATTKRRLANDTLSSSTCDTLSSSTCDTLSSLNTDKELRGKEQQQHLVLVEATPAAAVDPSTIVEADKDTRGVEDGTAPIRELVQSILALRTGAFPKPVRQAVAANPEHAAYVLAEWPSEEPLLAGEIRSLGAFLVSILQNVHWVSARDQERRKREHQRSQQQPSEPRERPEERAARYEAKRPLARAQEVERAAQLEAEREQVRAQEAAREAHMNTLPSWLREACEAEARKRMGPFAKNAGAITPMARAIHDEFVAGTWTPASGVTPAASTCSSLAESGSVLDGLEDEAEREPELTPEQAARIRRAHIQNSAQAAGEFWTELSEADQVRVLDRAREMVAALDVPEATQAALLPSMRDRALREMLREGSLSLGDDQVLAA